LAVSSSGIARRQHGRPPITLEVSCTERSGMDVRVTDTGPELPVVRDTDIAAAHGRGIALVDLLSDDWGVEQADPGKQVWFRLAPTA
jgi:hypothetical protein